MQFFRLIYQIIRWVCDSYSNILKPLQPLVSKEYSANNYVPFIWDLMKA
jgi:hypothetical protein